MNRRFRTSERPDIEQLSRRLEKVVAAWEASIADTTSPTPSVDSQKLRRPVADVLRDLEAERESLREKARRVADQVVAAARSGEVWEKRAMLAVQAGRDDLAKAALRGHQRQVDAVEQLRAESHLTASMCEALEEAIETLRASVPPG